MLPLLREMSATVSAVRNDDESATAVVLDKYAFDDSFPHGAIYTFTETLAKNRGLFPMSFTGLVWSDPAAGGLMAVSEGGDVQVLTDGDVVEDGINDIRGPLRDIAGIDGDIYVCGANHQVWKRKGVENWVDIGPDTQAQDQFPDNHLEAIDGFSGSEIYAAGRDGVIWWYDGSHWTAVQVPTNLSFLCVTCASDGQVYFGGQAGVIAVGRRDAFEVHTPDDPQADIWGIAFFDDTLFAAMSRALMTWDEDDGLLPEIAAMEIADTFYSLECGPASLWSIGGKDVLRLMDDEWERFDEVPVED